MDFACLYPSFFLTTHNEKCIIMPSIRVVSQSHKPREARFIRVSMETMKMVKSLPAINEL